MLDKTKVETCDKVNREGTKVHERQYKELLSSFAKLNKLANPKLFPACQRQWRARRETEKEWILLELEQTTVKSQERMKRDKVSGEGTAHLLLSSPPTGWAGLRWWVNISVLLRGAENCGFHPHCRTMKRLQEVAADLSRGGRSRRWVCIEWPRFTSSGTLWCKIHSHRLRSIYQSLTW